MRNMVTELKDKYSMLGIRNIKDDGNTYCRSVYYAYFESIIRYQHIDSLIDL